MEMRGYGDFDRVWMLPSSDAVQEAIRDLGVHNARFPNLRVALGRHGGPYSPLRPFNMEVPPADEAGYLARAAAAGAELEDAAADFMHSAAQEAIAAGDFSAACVGASCSPRVLDDLLACFVSACGL